MASIAKSFQFSTCELAHKPFPCRPPPPKKKHQKKTGQYPYYYQGNDGYPTETQLLMQHDAFGGDAAIYIYSEKENYVERNYDKFEGTHQM